MSPWITKEAAGHEQEHDLSTILSEKQRIELVLLINNISDGMRKKLSDAFDAPKTDTKKPTNNLFLDQITPHKETEVEAKARKIRENRVRDLSESKQQELKATALNHLHEWSASVIKRVTESIAHSLDKDKKPLQEIPESKATADADTQDLDALLMRFYPPTSTTLYSLPRGARILLLQAMLMLLLSLGHYAAPSRILLLNMASSLHIPFHVLSAIEVMTAKGLVEGATDTGEDEVTKKLHEREKAARIWKLVLAGAAGAALVGLSGGLLAPEVAGGLATVIGGWGLEATMAADLLGTLAESNIAVGAIFGAYGGLVSYKMMDEYAKEVQDFAFLPLYPQPAPESTATHMMKHLGLGHGHSHGHAPAPAAVQVNEGRLRVTVGVSGWLETKEDIISPWRVLGPSSSDIFALRWELDALLRLGDGVANLEDNKIWGAVKKELISRTGLDKLEDMLWPLKVLEVSEEVVDNPFNVALARADMVGVVLADALAKEALGKRPVCLVGYSLGSRVIYSCLLELAARRRFDLVEDVVLMGSPCPSDERFWRVMRTVVSGRLVNVYSKRDMVLALLYRVLGVQLGIAGVQEVKGVNGVENLDVGAMVSSHTRYRDLVGQILIKVGWEGLDEAEVEKEV